MDISGLEVHTGKERSGERKKRRRGGTKLAHQSQETEALPGGILSIPP